jgi:hypothetical protein
MTKRQQVLYSEKTGDIIHKFFELVHREEEEMV